tara:strand:+ start:12 stop:743 length:732 start_codon:yes stop_codon:yes gene_type:complete
MTIDEIYRLVQTFSNKEQRGFLTPVDFNLLAKQAELELYNKRLSIVMEKSQPKKAAGYYSEGVTPELAEQDLSQFLKTTVVATTTDATVGHIGSSNSLLTDYIVSISTADNETQSMSTNVPVEIVNNKNINQILRSSLAKPSISYPVALIGQSSVANQKLINVFPDTITSVTVTHYLHDYSPKWGYITIAGKPVYDTSGSTQFKSSNRTHGELVIKILEYLGISIREADLATYAQNKGVTQDN